MKLILALACYIIQNSESCSRQSDLETDELGGSGGIGGSRSGGGRGGRSLVLAIGGVRARNGSHEVGSMKVDILNDHGVCSSETRISLPMPICKLKAVRLDQFGAVLLCGTKNCRLETENLHEFHDLEHGNNHICLVWQRGSSSQFQVLHAIKSRLPMKSGPGKSREFDLVSTGNDGLMFRQSGETSTWKGIIDDKFQMFWYEVKPLPQAFKGTCSLALDGRFYILGGHREMFDGGTHLSPHFFRYIETDLGHQVGWQMLSPMELPSTNLACVALEQGVLALGGESGKPILWSKIEDQWIRYEANPFLGQDMKKGSTLAKCVVHGHERIFLIGGESEGGSRVTYQNRFSNKIRTWSPPSQEWNTMEQVLQEPRAEVAAVEVPKSWVPWC